MDLPDTTKFVSGASRGLRKHLAGQPRDARREPLIPAG
jgi:hypothetical protein